MTSQVESTTMTAAENAAQAEAWNGSTGEHWAEHARRYNHATRRHARRLFDAAAISATDAVLDVGCGTGSTTRRAAQVATRGSAVGVDLSAVMLERAREESRVEGLTNVSFVQADAQVHQFGEHAFDVAISSFGVMFFADPVAAFANIGASLRPGGRVAFLVFRELARNEWLTAVRAAVALGRQLPEPPPGVPSPFALADPGRVRPILTAAGYEAIEFESVDEPIDWGTDVDDAFAFVSTVDVVEGLTRDLDDDRRAQALTALRETIADHATADGVLFGTSNWVITARRP
jgi:SAM-dependent methyltransferase